MILVKIYSGHSSSIDYRKRIYEPLKNSELNEEYGILLPHEESEELFDSKTFLKTERIKAPKS